jgi:hypothetical protein
LISIKWADEIRHSILIYQAMSSPPEFSGIRVTWTLIFHVVFCRSWFVLFLLAAVLYVLLRFMVSDYPVGIFKFFLVLSVYILHVFYIHILVVFVIPEVPCVSTLWNTFTLEWYFFYYFHQIKTWTWCRRLEVGIWYNFDRNWQGTRVNL